MNDEFNNPKEMTKQEQDVQLERLRNLKVCNHLIFNDATLTIPQVLSHMSDREIEQMFADSIPVRYVLLDYGRMAKR